MNTRITRLAFLSFLCIFLLIAGDLGWDYVKGLTWTHIGAELAVLVIATFSAGLAFYLLRQEAAAMRRLESDLARAREESRHWRGQTRELVAGLGAAIEAKFCDWSLSEAESQVGLLLLKGFSHKEIAGLRRTSERTVREQARSLYRKAGLNGRASLSAYFLEDLLLPQPEPTPSKMSKA